MRNSLLLAFVTFFIIGCKPTFNKSLTSYIIGSNDIRVLADPAGINFNDLAYSSSVVITTDLSPTKKKFCSGTLIQSSTEGGNYRILTNFHCFLPDENLSSDILAGHCSSTRVYHGFFKPNMDRVFKTKCKVTGDFSWDVEGDLALFEIEENPSIKDSEGNELYRPANLQKVFDTSYPTNAMLVHYPFIDQLRDDYLELTHLDQDSGIRIPYGQVTDQNCKVEGIFDQNEWQYDAALSMGVKHDCDQQKGSSGSALWRLGSSEIIGINWGGIKLKYSNEDSERVYNVATNINYGIDFISGNLREKYASADMVPSGARMTEVQNTEAEEKNKKCGILGAGFSGSLYSYLLLLPILGVFFRRS